MWERVENSKGVITILLKTCRKETAIERHQRLRDIRYGKIANVTREDLSETPPVRKDRLIV